MEVIFIVSINLIRPFVVSPQRLLSHLKMRLLASPCLATSGLEDLPGLSSAPDNSDLDEDNAVD